MSQMHVIDYQIFGDDMQFVEIELDPDEAAIGASVQRSTDQPRWHRVQGALDLREVVDGTEFADHLLAEGLEVGLEGVQGAAQLLVHVRETALAEREALDPYPIGYGVLVAKGTDFDVHQFGELARQILDVNTGSPIDIGRVFACEQEYFHRGAFQAVIAEVERGLAALPEDPIVEVVILTKKPGCRHAK